MKNKHLIPVFFLAVTLLSSCEAIGDIFQAGMYVGIFAVIAVVIAIIWLMRFFTGRRG
jgi:hypothetical protein